MESLIGSLNHPTPWVWYIVRSSGVAAYILLWITIFLGLAIRNPFLKKLIQPVYSVAFHSFIGALALVLVFVHALGLLLDRNVVMGIKDIFIPFHPNAANLNTNYLSMGIIALYGMIIIVATSYLKKKLKFTLWRVLHFISPLVFIMVVYHGVQIGTDMKNVYVATIFVSSSLFVMLLYVWGLILRLRKNT